MSLSFEESLKKNMENNTANSNMKVRTMSLNNENTGNTITEDYSVMTLSEDSGIVAYADEDWQRHSYYTYYSVFSDDNMSTISDAKDIVINSKQFNITQEENSQYIPFEMSRYYDGFDLVDAIISIHYETSSGRHSACKPVNVKYNSEKIRFAWLVDSGATLDAGKLKFEIHAYGTVTGDDGVALGYVWKSRSNESLNVLQSLCDCEEVVNNIDDSWLQELITEVAERVAEEIKNVSVGEEVNAAKEAAAEAQGYAESARQYSTTAANAASEAVRVALTNYATTDYVDEAVAGVDVSGQLQDYVKTTDLETNYYNKTDTTQLINNVVDGKGFATKDDIDDAISSADLDSYYKKTETYSQQEIDDKLANVSVDLDGYATETYVNNKTDVLSGEINTNKEGISTLSTTVQDLQDSINSIDTSPRLTYEATYGSVEMEDGSTSEHMFTLWETEGENEPTVKSRFQISGGGGGGSSTSTSLKIEYITTSPLVVTLNDKAIIKYRFSGVDSSGDVVTEGTAVWKIAGRIVATNIATNNADNNGENEFDITDFLSIGQNKVSLSITDDAGSLVTKNWTVQKIDVRLESSFNDKLTYPLGPVSFDYTPYGAVSKDIHFKLDGVEIGNITTTSSGIPMSYEIPPQTHGSHLLEVYMTTTINGNTIESNHILKDIIWYDETSTVPVIGTTYQNFTARQYDTTNIEYTVYDPTTESPTVTIAIDNEVASTSTLTSSTAIYPYKAIEAGTKTITITCGETVKTLTATIEALDINITPVTAGLVFDFNPVGKSNNDTDRVWTDGIHSMGVSENFDWINGGYQIDSNGDQFFCIKAGTSAEIDYQLFADDAKRNGKEMKLVFKTTNVAKPNACFLHCVDNTTGDNHIGIEMFSQEAYIYGQSDKLHLPYSEEDIIEFEFNISKNTEDIAMVMGYEDGVSTCPMVYDDSSSFTQNTPKVISLGSDDCDLHIYRFKVYNSSLTARGILNNFIADARNAEEMISRYDRNQIYDENGNLNPDILAEKCPWLRIIKIEAPYFTNNKSDKVPNTTIEHIYKNGDPVLDNWTAYNSCHSGQGTSSNNYGAAGRNLDLIMNKSGLDGVEPYIILGDGSEVNEITLTRTSVPANYLNVKVNIASSENANNALLQRRYNQFNPYNRPFVREESVDTSFIKDTMEFYNSVVFIRETDSDMSTHREFADNDWHFYAISNVGDSKKSDFSRLTDQNDPYECCVEIMDVELPLSDFPKDTMMEAMGYTIPEGSEERIYTWAKDENLGILYEKINGEYVLTSDQTVDLSKTYYVDILEHDDFSEDYTYGWRYISDDKDEEILDYCHQKWIDFYRFVTNSTDEEFKAHLGDYMILDSALYYYLFTSRYLMIDNRAKNSFWHYGKTGEVDTDGNPIRKWSLAWAYDMDSSLGINNYGDMVYRYGLEDTDIDDTGTEVFRESDSTFFCRLRDLFIPELKALYNTLESQNAWHGESLINQFDAWQNEFPEELWRVDIERKYIRTYNSSFINGEGDSQFLVNMAHGKKKYQRRQWERNQEKYMASKYQSSVASSDNAVLRCTVPSGNVVVAPNYKLKLTPYAYMYLNVKYGTTNPIQVKAEPNVEYEIPFTGNSADIVDIYSASMLQSLGDLSSCYAATIDTSKASKLKELIVGNETEGYDNPSLTTLTLGSNYLLEKLNVENVSGLTQSLNLSVLNNLKELYAHGSNVGGVTFADGGLIEIAELPAINSMTMKNLMYLINLDITSLDKLTTLTAENCSNVDLLTILKNAINVNRVRIVGIDWNLDDTSILDRLYEMSGIDRNGYNQDQSVVAGVVHVPTIRQQQLLNYQNAWPDLEIIANTIIPEYAVTFMNSDNTVLDIYYVIEGSTFQFNKNTMETKFIEPETGKEVLVDITPTIPSTVSHDFTFAGWDISSISVFENITITATYTESLREYTVKYVSKGVTLQETKGLYGENVPYTGVYPTYTAEESGNNYYLFNRWDKSGFVDGDKTVNAVFDSIRGVPSIFEGKELENMTPIEIYALTKLDEKGSLSIENIITDKDPYTFTIGQDFDYDDIESELLISEKTHFDGTNYIDTNIQLFDEDKDFVLAIDYEFLDGNNSGAVLAQCFQTNSNQGFKLSYGSDNDSFTGVMFNWGSSADNVVAVNKREMIIIRHKKDNNNLMVYKSNLDENEILVAELTRDKATTVISTLVFGCSKAADGRYEKYAIGNIHWAKIWYADLGEDTCKSLASWIHESMTVEACGYRRYYLADNQTKRCSFSLLASHLLSRTKRWNPSYTTNGDIGTGNSGGWVASELCDALNTRLYNAMPTQIKLLIKRTIVFSSAGLNSTELVPSYEDIENRNIPDNYCYITIPSVSEINVSITSTPYGSEGEYIDYISNAETRKRSFADGDYSAYWLRSPYIYGSSGTATNNQKNYIYRVTEVGETNGVTSPNSNLGVLIMFSF